VTLLRRLAVILFAFLVSAAAAIPVVLLLSIVAGNMPVLDAEVLPYLVIAFVFVAVLAFLPAAAVIGLAEWKRIRHWLFFTAAGGLTAQLLLFLLGFVQGLQWPTALNWVILTVGGLAAGFVYWLIAGKTSGELADA
jgi:hypothetical protein